MQRIVLLDEDAEVEPVPTSEGGRGAEAELDRLSNIIHSFNDLFGDIEWEDRDRVHELITETIPGRVGEDKAFKNARENSDKEDARIEHDKDLERVVMAVMKDDTELFKQLMDNASFKRWMTDTVFTIAYEELLDGSFSRRVIRCGKWNELPVPTGSMGATGSWGYLRRDGLVDAGAPCMTEWWTLTTPWSTAASVIEEIVALGALPSPPRPTWEPSHARSRARLRVHRRLPRAAAARRRGNPVDEDQITLSTGCSR